MRAKIQSALLHQLSWLKFTDPICESRYHRVGDVHFPFKTWAAKNYYFSFFFSLAFVSETYSHT